jgi:hypothetical protein
MNDSMLQAKKLIKLTKFCQLVFARYWTHKHKYENTVMNEYPSYYPPSYVTTCSRNMYLNDIIFKW